MNTDDGTFQGRTGIFGGAADRAEGAADESIEFETVQDGCTQCVSATLEEAQAFANAEGPWAMSIYEVRRRLVSRNGIAGALASRAEGAPAAVPREREALPELPKPWATVLDTMGLPVEVYRRFEMLTFARAAVVAGANPAPPCLSVEAATLIGNTHRVSIATIRAIETALASSDPVSNERETKLHDAICQAVGIMNMSFDIARSEDGRKAKDILRQALADYADDFMDQPTSEGEQLAMRRLHK